MRSQNTSSNWSCQSIREQNYQKKELPITTILKRTYGSASQAAAKRDQILADMASRKVYLQAQLTSLQRALSSDIAQAAVYERQRKAIPAALQKSLQTNRKNVSEAEQNIRAISERQQEIRQQYDETIRRLNKL